MATLTGERIKDTYDGLLKLKDSQALTSSNKVITDGLDNDTALSISSIGVEVNGGTTLNGATEATGEVEVNVTDLANTATEGIRIDLNKNSAGTGYSTKTIALETLANNQGTAQYYATNGIRSVSQHTGTGDGYFLSGVISTTTNEGSGSLAALYGTYTTLNSNGTGVQDVDYMIGNTISMNFNNPNLDVNRVGAINAQLNFNEATTINTEAYVMLLDVDFTGVTGTDIPVGGDFAYLFIKPHTATDIVSTTGSARAINSESTLPSRFAGDMHFEGNVGIGTTSPSAPLNIVNYNPKIVLEDSDNANTFGQIRQQAGNLQLLANNNTSNGTMQFKLDNGTTVTDVMRIDSSGNVGIGTTSPSKKLHLVSSTTGDGLIIENDTAEAAFYIKGVGDTQNTYSFVKNQGIDGLLLRHNSDTFGFGGNIASFLRNGNVGIGTTSPSVTLDVASDNPKIRLTDTDGGIAAIEGNLGNLILIADNGNTEADSRVAFKVDGSEKMRIDSSGNVGIGTTSPSQKLEVEGNIYTGGSIRITDIGNQLEFGNANVALQRTSNLLELGGYDGIVFKSSNTVLDSQSERMRITSGGNVGIGTTSPSYSLHVDSGDVETIAHFKSSDNRGRISIADDDTTSYIISEGSKMSLGTVAYINTSNLTIDSSGKVGIGTTSPNYALDVVGSLNNVAKLTSSTTKSQLLFADSDSTDTVAIGSEGDDFNVRVDNGDINLKTGSGATATTSVKINSSGNVGIGTTSPTHKLDINSGIANSALRVFSTDRYTGIKFEDDTNNDTLFYDGQSDLMYLGSTNFRAVDIYATGNVGIGTTSPSEKLEVVGDAKMTGKLNVGTTTDYADNAAALLAGLVVGDIYRTGDTLKIVH